MLNTSLNLQRLNAGLAEIVSELKSTIKVKRNKSVSIPIEFINQGNDFIISYAIKEIVDENFTVKLESNDLKKIFALSKKQSGKSEELIENLVALKERDGITIQKKSSAKITNGIKINIGNEVRDWW